MSVANFNDTTPTAPSGKTNVKWQQSGDSISAYVDTSTLTARTINTTAPLTGGGDLSADRTFAISDFTGDTGAGGTKGSVPAPAAGDAAAGKFIKADGTWAVPPGATTGTVTHTGGALTADAPVFGAGTGDVKVGTKSGNTNELATVSGALTSGHQLVADASGNLVDGGAPGVGTVTHTGGSLTADLPMFGAGTADSKVGTKSGNTNEVATVTGSVTSGHLAAWDASGNLVDGGVQGAGQPYDVVCSLVGKPGDAAIVMILTAARAVNFAANFAGSYGSVGTNPTSTATYTVKNNGTSIGTVAISTSGVFTFATVSGTTKSLAAGDRLTITAPTPQDSTLSDAGFTLAGTR